MNLKPWFKERLCNALADAFDLEGIKRVCSFCLEGSARQIRLNHTLDDACFDLVGWAEDRGEAAVLRLLECVAEQRQDKPIFRELLEEYKRDIAAAVSEPQDGPAGFGAVTPAPDGRRRWLDRAQLRENPYRQVELFKVIPPGHPDKANWSRLFVSDDDLPHMLAVTPKHFIVYAGHGHGKSEHQRVCELDCWPQQPTKDVLAVPFTAPNLRALLESPVSTSRSRRRTRAVDLMDFIANIIEAAYGIIASHRPHHGPSTPAFDRASAEESWKQLQGHCTAIHARDGRGGGLHAVSQRELLGDFKRCLEQRGFRSVVILVDEIVTAASDASASGRPVTQVDFLKPILSGCEQLDEQWIKLIVFASRECRQHWSRRDWYLRLAGRCEEVEIEWTKARLLEMLNRRLLEFRINRGNGPSQFEELCEQPALANIHDELVNFSGYHPVAAIRLAELLIEKQCQLDPDSPRISVAAWEAVKVRWAKSEQQKFEPSGMAAEQCGPGLTP